MVATYFVPAPAHHAASGILDSDLLAIGIGMGATGILALTMLAAVVDRHMKRIEQDLLNSNRSLQSVFDGSPDAIVVVARNCGIQLFSPAAQQMFGYDADEAIGQPLELVIAEDETLAPAGKAKDAGDVAQALASVSREATGMRKNGSCFPVDMSDSAIELNGESASIYIIRDITRRKRIEGELVAAIRLVTDSERALRGSQVRYELAVRGANGGIWDWNLETGEIFNSPQLLEVMGEDQTDADCMDKILELTHAEDRERLASDIENRLLSNDGVLNGEYRICRPDGELKWVHIIGATAFNKDGQPVRAAGSVVDVTERKQAEDERAQLLRDLSQAQKMESLGTLSGGIAHEINTPVQYVGDNVRFLRDAFVGLTKAVEGYSKLARASDAIAELAEPLAEAAATAEEADLEFLLNEVPDSLDQALEGIGRISEIVTAIKEFSHPGGKDKSLVDINHAIKTTATVTRNQWKYVAELDFDLDENLPAVPCLPGEFNQVMLNLIVNAAQAIEDTGEHGRITVQTKSADGWVTIRISDTGCGIDQENLEKIFEPFFTTKEVGRGTGQGLSIAHGIVTKKHGGAIEVESTIGKGTTFSIRLPLRESEQAEAA